MRAIQVHSYGGPEELRSDDLPLPEPGPGAVRVKLAAAGVNFIDIYKRTGAYKVPLPLTLGEEGAGVVDSVGAGVGDFAAGDRVAYALETGSYAEYAVVPAAKLVALPGGVSFATGAAVMLQGMTAHYLSHSTYALKPGDTCVVHAAAGGVGLLLTQLAKLRGARVIGTVSTDEKERLARAAGADEIIRYTEQDYASELRRLSGGAGVEVIYDSVGRDTFEAGLGCLKPRGMLVLYGQSSGAVAPLDPQILNAKGSLFVTRPTLGHYLLNRDELLWRAGELFDLMAAGKLDVRIGATYALGDAAAAQTALAGRATTGKVLLIP